MSDAYAKKSAAYAWTTVSYNRTEGSLELKIATEGTYPEMPKSRHIELRVVQSSLIKGSLIMMNGWPTDIKFSRYGSEPGTWSYDGATATAIIRLPGYSVSKGLEVTVNFETQSDIAELTKKVKGMISRANLAKAELDLVRTTPGAHEANKGALDRIAVAGEELSRGVDVSAWFKVLSGMKDAWAAAVDEVSNMKEGDSRGEYVLGLLKSV